MKVKNVFRAMMTILLLAVSFNVQAQSGGTPKTAAEFAERAETYYENKEYAKAIADFNQALKLEPNGEKTVLYYLARGVVYCDMEEFDKALADINHADKLMPNNAGILAWRGNVYALKAEKRNPKDDTDDLRRRALEDLDKAIELKPDYAWAYGRRGYYYEDTGNRDRALADYNRSIQLNPSDPEVYKDRGYL